MNITEISALVHQFCISRVSVKSKHESLMQSVLACHLEFSHISKTKTRIPSVPSINIFTNVVLMSFGPSYLDHMNLSVAMRVAIRFHTFITELSKCNRKLYSKFFLAFFNCGTISIRFLASPSPRMFKNVKATYFAIFDLLQTHSFIVFSSQ